MSFLVLMLLAWAIEAVCGWPDWLFNRIKHPVVWIGAAIALLDRTFNRPTLGHRTRYLLGVITVGLVVGVATVLAVWVSSLLSETIPGLLIEAVICSSFLASRSLYQHVAEVEQALRADDLGSAKTSVSQIVGRDTSDMSASNVSQAAIESLAENTSDGVVAPLFWGCLLGLPGLVLYKAINTLDSMIGHRSHKYLAFGGFAARLDDVANYVPARLTAVIIAACRQWKRVMEVTIRDARSHRSVNAGWPEAALAARLNIKVAGPRTYDGQTTDDPWINEGGVSPSAIHLADAIRVYRQSLGGAFLVLLIIVVSLAL